MPEIPSALDVAEVQPAARWVVWVETAVLTSVAPCLGYALNARDPFFIEGHFPWPMLAPLLAGLRYGFLAGFGSSLATALALVLAWREHWLPLAAFPGQFAVALAMVGMIAGEFSDLWTARLRRLVAINGYQRQKLAEFSRNYHLVKVSHDAMEQRSATSAQSLRNALFATRVDLLRSGTAGDSLQGCGNVLLGLFARFGQVQIASVLPTDAHGRLGSAVAHLGQAPAQADVRFEPLAQEALGTKTVVSLAGSVDDPDRGTANLAAVPCIDAEDRIRAMVLVREMPFVAYCPENFRLLGLIGGHFADSLAFGAGMNPDAGDVRAFERKVRRCALDARRYRLPASLLTFSLRESNAAPGALVSLTESRRGFDQAVVLRGRDSSIRIFVLMPLTDRVGVNGYLGRLARMVEERHGVSLEQAGIVLTGAAAVEDQDGARLFADMMTFAAEGLPLAGHDSRG